MAELDYITLLSWMRRSLNDGEDGGIVVEFEEGKIEIGINRKTLRTTAG